MPPKFRPVNFVGGLMSDNKQTSVLRKIVQDTYIVKTALFCNQKNSMEDIPEESQRMLNILQGKSLSEKLHTAWHELQKNVNMILDTSTIKADQSKNLVGFKQVLLVLKTQVAGNSINFSSNCSHCRFWRRSKDSCE
jgi:DNA-directed RNA polymerase I subunit RPA1